MHVIWSGDIWLMSLGDKWFPFFYISELGVFREWIKAISYVCAEWLKMDVCAFTLRSIIWKNNHSCKLTSFGVKIVSMILFLNILTDEQSSQIKDDSTQRKAKITWLTRKNSCNQSWPQLHNAYQETKPKAHIWSLEPYDSLYLICSHHKGNSYNLA